MLYKPLTTGIPDADEPEEKVRIDNKAPLWNDKDFQEMMESLENQKFTLEEFKRAINEFR